MKGVILSSKFVEDSLIVQFGKILPIELPIYNQPLLSFQLKYLSTYCDEIYVTVPDGYTTKVTKNLTVLSYSTHLSIIELLTQISQHFSHDEKLFIHYGDSLFLNLNGIESSKSYFFVQKPDYQYSWGLSTNDGLVPAGGIIITNSELKSLLKDCSDFDELVRKIFCSSSSLLLDNFQWLDFGHSLTYYSSRVRFLETRSFNKLQFDGQFLIKSSQDILKMWSEYKWLTQIKNKLPSCVPFVCDFAVLGDHAQYSIEYISHPPLSDIFVFGKLNDLYFIRILESIKSTLSDFKSVFSGNIPNLRTNFLIDKLEKRKFDILRISTNLGVEPSLIEDIIKSNISFFSDLEQPWSFMHGDLCFSNILFNFSIFKPIFIDPRGYISTEAGFSMFGPKNYDIYKLAHSYVMGYDFQIAEISCDLFFSLEEIKKRLFIFCEIFEVEREELIMGLINLFLSMIPLHINSPKRQLSFIRTIKVLNNL